MRAVNILLIKLKTLRELIMRGGISCTAKQLQIGLMLAN